MFKPHFGKCVGTNKIEGCGKDGWIMTRSRGLCSSCESGRKKRSVIKKKAPKNIGENKKYYAKKITENILANKGRCICENCDAEIKHPKGMNVSHIISAGANIALYHEIENSFILCLRCEDTWTCRDKTTMRIYEESERRRIELTHRYYTNKN